MCMFRCSWFVSGKSGPFERGNATGLYHVHHGPRIFAFILLVSIINRRMSFPWLVRLVWFPTWSAMCTKSFQNVVHQPSQDNAFTRWMYRTMYYYPSRYMICCSLPEWFPRKKQSPQLPVAATFLALKLFTGHENIFAMWQTKDTQETIKTKWTATSASSQVLKVIKPLRPWGIARADTSAYISYLQQGNVAQLSQRTKVLTNKHLSGNAVNKTRFQMYEKRRHAYEIVERTHIDRRCFLPTMTMVAIMCTIHQSIVAGTW